ncbi:hypothetical protein FA15DRAFT_145734 [Coprinopsis marcescibilis]|uniref:Methyltransferase domain-containing protein n=1 Tax=Coprinopsis marcescibilis TaxID=230819 RepID=A0A5C3L4M0_COPMA|nr:hypothetical protein FA15DRAFT_145734 [Coprinopsis marcescibilis]
MPPKSDASIELRSSASSSSLPRAPELQRSYTSPAVPARDVGPSNGPHTTLVPVLRKRHSNYLRGSERSTSPIPELPPHRPPRNPARTGSIISDIQAPRQKSKPRSRPSTAGGTKEDVTPWEFQPGPAEFQEVSRMRSASVAPSLKSKASSTGMGTGPVEEVTPWELFPAPVTLPSPKHSASTPITSSAPSLRLLHPVRSTGLVEDVTPWELEPSPMAIHPVPYDLPLPPPLASSRSSLLSEPSGSSMHNRISTATGPTEEVTPWELQAVPTTEDVPEKEPPKPLRQRNSLTMSKAQLEEVMPWELYPVPPLPVMNGGSSIPKNGPQSARLSTSSTKASLSDFSLIRRRRSTGSRPVKGRSNSHSNTPKPSTRQPSSHSPPTNGHDHDRIPMPRSAMSSAAISSSDVWPDNASASSEQMVPPSGRSASKRTKSTKSHGSNANFSTADRTILEELKRNINVRNAQFIMKGVAVHLTDGSVSSGKKHHPYSPRDVPYPRSYCREVIDLDVWETLFCQDICESLTWHVFEEPPIKVLDIGCGTGTWILNCARTWRETQFVGLDIVPLHPDLQQVGSSELASRITWVQANFLEGLPFPKDEFDFVHIKRIALGVPEDKWDALFDEISRVMKPGGALEMVEEDLFFPGKLMDHDEDQAYAPSMLSRSSSVTSNNGRSDFPGPIQEADGDEKRSRESSTDATPVTSTPATTNPPSCPPSPIHVIVNGGNVRDNDNDDAKSNAGTTTPPGSPKGYITLIPPHSRSTARPLLYVKPGHHSYGHLFAASTSPPKPASSSFSNSAVSLLNSLTHSHSDSDHNHNLFRRRRSSSNLTSASSVVAQPLLNTIPSSTSVDSSREVPPPIPAPKIVPLLLRTPAKAPANPRDHSLLEYIYTETLSSRFINSSPLALLSTYLEYHFKDARSHPPLMYTFPPKPARHILDDDDSSSDSDDGDFAFPLPPKVERSPVRSKSSRKSLSPSSRSGLSDENGELYEEHRWLSMQGLLRQSSPYVSLDGSLGYGYSPAPKSSFNFSVSMGSNGKSESRMPNKTLNIDLRTLNLHLALRAKEILACSETMWEWIRETQHSPRRRGPPRGPSFEAPRASGSFGHSAPPNYRSTVLDMSRDDFNQLLLNFEMDMQDQASVSSALRERFHWSVIDSAPSQSRKIFNTACDKYEKWLKSERRSSFSLGRPSRNSLSNLLTAGLATPTAFETPLATPRPFRNRSNSHNLLSSRPSAGEMNGKPYGPPSIAPSRSEASVHFAPPPVIEHLELAPTQKLSRTMRVFVAWKPEDPAT